MYISSQSRVAGEIGWISLAEFLLSSMDVSCCLLLCLPFLSFFTLHFFRTRFYLFFQYYAYLEVLGSYLVEELTIWATRDSRDVLP